MNHKITVDVALFSPLPRALLDFLVAECLGTGRWFAVEPWPDGQWCLMVKPEAQLHLATGIAEWNQKNPPPAIPDKDCWSPADRAAAQAEGWGIFQIDGADEARAAQNVTGRPYGHRPFELCKVDEAGLFPDDIAAHLHVLLNFGVGNPLHTKALAFLYQHSRPECDAVLLLGSTLPGHLMDRLKNYQPLRVEA